LPTDQSDEEAAAAAWQILIEASAQHLLILASESEQTAPRSATEVITPSINHCPPDPCSGDVWDMPVAEARQESRLASSLHASPSSDGFSVPDKLRLQLSRLSSTTLVAAGFTIMPVETPLWISIKSVSVLA